MSWVVAVVLGLVKVDIVVVVVVVVGGAVGLAGVGVRAVVSRCVCLFEEEREREGDGIGGEKVVSFIHCNMTVQREGRRLAGMMSNGCVKFRSQKEVEGAAESGSSQPGADSSVRSAEKMVVPV